MRKLLACLCTSVLLVCLPLSGPAAGSCYGTVVFVIPVAVRAPFVGTLADITVRPGNRSCANDEVYIDFKADDSIRSGILVSVEIP